MGTELPSPPPLPAPPRRPVAPARVLRIFSDLHFGDHSSRLRSLAEIAPLLDGAEAVWLNGDTLDTRRGPYPQRTAELRAEVAAFFRRAHDRVTFLTGNHDPDVSGLHAGTLAGGQVFVTHGDVIFDGIVPWGRDTSRIRGLLALERERAGAAAATLEGRLAVFRRVCAGIPQRHQAEPDRWRHLVSFARDTFWPPHHAWRVLRAWQDAPGRAAELARVHRPAARFMVIGHTHRPGIWRFPDGLVLINTGSFCPPLGARIVELGAGRLTVRRIVRRRGAYHPGAELAAIPLTAASGAPILPS